MGSNRHVNQPAVWCRSAANPHRASLNEDAATGAVTSQAVTSILIDWVAGPAGNFGGGYNYTINGCSPFSSSTITGQTSNIGNTLNLTLNEGSNVYNVTAVIDPTGNTINGTYKGGTAACADNGGFVATRIPANALAGTYNSDLLGGSLSLTIAEDANYNLTINGSDNADGAFTLSGTAVGNSGTVSGAIAGTQVTYSGLLISRGYLAVVDQNYNLIAILQKQ